MNVDYTSFALKLKTSGVIRSSVCRRSNCCRLLMALDDSNLRKRDEYYMAVFGLEYMEEVGN